MLTMCLQQMRFIANVEVGAYTDDYEDVDPRLLQEYYGVSQRWRSCAAAEETGAGHSDNEMGGEDDRDAEGPTRRSRTSLLVDTSHP